jgi:aspartate aminotransferase
MGKLSQLAETLIGSEIVRLGNEINARITAGEKISNLTIGDFKPQIFPIPQEYEDAIIEAYKNKYTNYPAGDGILKLREAVSAFYKTFLNLDYGVSEIQIASGGRPLIYSIFRTLVDEGDKVLYPVPSWNNNHYTHFNAGQHVLIETTAENKFMPTPVELAPHMHDVRLIALCSPLNPTGTTFSKDALAEICNMVVAENARRNAEAKKVYVLYDQIYFALTHGETVHVNPVSLNPAMKEYTIFVDGVSKCFAATGVRVGWSAGPAHVIAKVKAILSHIGAWAPMAEQVATAQYLQNTDAVNTFLASFKQQLSDRLFAFHNGFQNMKTKGLSVDSIVPEAAMYLTVKIDVKGKQKANGTVLEKQADVWQFLLDDAQVAVVPFSSFGAGKESPWYRFSVGTCTLEEIAGILTRVENAINSLH